jgi:hypothetical protein
VFFKSKKKKIRTNNPLNSAAIQANVPLLLSLLGEQDFYVRFNTVKLLTTLLTNQPQKLQVFFCAPFHPNNGCVFQLNLHWQWQECILKSPLGISLLVELITDQREVIRNEVGLTAKQTHGHVAQSNLQALLLMIELTKSNADVQKIVAFNSAFERLLSIVHDEGYSEGGIIVEDCLKLCHNLLKGNDQTQLLFREAKYVLNYLHPHITLTKMVWQRHFQDCSFL